MRRWPHALPLLLIWATACPGRPRPEVGPRRRPPAPGDPEAAEDFALDRAEAAAARRPRDPAVWQTLRRLARRAGQPHRVLLALEAAEARGRLPGALRATLAAGLRRRARTLDRLGAPAAALDALTRAQRLRPAGPGAGVHALRDRLTLRLADRRLRMDEPQAALQVYQRLARRAVLVGEAQRWRLAAAGQTRAPGAVAMALRRLRGRAPAVSARLARAYSLGTGQAPETLLLALEAASAGPDPRLTDSLDTRLSRVAPLPLLARACQLRRRPGSPCCLTLQRWATHRPAALDRWAALCRRLHWPPGDRTWLLRALRLLESVGVPGLGPLEGLVDAALARQVLPSFKAHPALLRLARPAALRQALRRGPGPAATITQLLQHGLEAWAAGLDAEARRALARVTAAVTTATPGSHNAAARCAVVRLTRLVHGAAAAFRFQAALAQRHPGARAPLVRTLLGCGDAAAALAVGRARHAPQARARLRRLGALLAAWGLIQDRTIRTGWERRYGTGPARQAWRHVQAGARHHARGPVAPGLRALTRLVDLLARGGLAEAEAFQRTRPGWQGAEWARWRAWIPRLRNHRGAALRRLRRWRHQHPAGFRWLPATMAVLTRMGLGAEAGRWADALYERAPTDPVLLAVVVRGAVAAGRYDKAELALTDWAAGTGRPDQAYLTAARWLAARGQHRRALAVASRALGWAGARPLAQTLVLLRLQQAARRRAEARRTAAWLLSRWPAGSAREGIRRTLAEAHLAADQVDAAREYHRGTRGLELPALWRRGRHAEVQARATVLARQEPFSARWPTLAALAALGLRRDKDAAALMERAARLDPRAAPLLHALLAAHRGQLPAALAHLALAGASAPDPAPLVRLAAALAARAGQRRLAARLLSTRAVRADDRDLALIRRLAAGQRLPVVIPWAMLRTAPQGAGSCVP